MCISIEGTATPSCDATHHSAFGRDAGGGLHYSSKLFWYLFPMQFKDYQEPAATWTGRSGGNPNREQIPWWRVRCPPSSDDPLNWYVVFFILGIHDTLVVSPL
ncbi:hypothetical protein M758_10G183900 [Ceratodon purpureus]|uniref:Uncharacterized protein n=1 Tax=Ceratodon purpureus TaxID=3225 RepID=A0A8T0GQG6_CERPU|nr:hypothetical protein KC19_10G188500 [Ceratodon purpureus]KAG0604605.1 hypothetical protein M758_10G183900 [Ceratodon purpureus]